ncbi:MAG: heavy metal transporter [Bacteroidales bacterium]|nr:heavy metal transporter [Bacteroidales bacterium]
MKTITINIENLKCHGCASTIKKGILKFDEVKDVEVNVEDSTVSISFEGNEEIIEQFKAKLSGLGYPESGHNTGFSVVKSYVSCAVGRMG